LDALGLLGKGFVAALGTAAIAIVWERATFTGLFDATENYRITGLFSSMHVGGAYAESFLLAALPFALCAALFSRSLSARLGIAALAAVGCYALAATFSRSAYVAFAVELVVLVGVLLTTRRAMRPGTQRLASSTSVGTVAVLALLVAVPIAIGPFATSRFAGIAKDAPARLNQWEEAAGLFEVRPTTVLLGMGLGRFPERYLWGGPAEGRPGTHRFETEDANTFLRLGAGQPLYFDQFVPVSRQSTYTFSFDTRQSEPGATLAVALCEKFILYSSRCIWVEVLRDRATGRGWVRFEQRVDTQDLGAGAWPLGRPVKLSLTNSGRTGHVDVDNVSLIRADGTETIANGSFSAGMDHWLFTADDFWPWHIENLFLHTFFEQGLVGLVVLLALVAVGSGRLLSARRVDGLQAAFLSAIAGLLAMGTLNTVINAPRPALVFFLLLFAGLLAPYQREARAGEA
jgi:O-antigen ligase